MPHSVTSCLQTYTKYAESFLIAITKLIEIILIFCDLTSALCKILFPSQWTPGTNMHAHSHSPPVPTWRDGWVVQFSTVHISVWIDISKIMQIDF